MRGMDGSKYQTDLTDEQWALIKPYIPPSKSGMRRGGRPPTDVRWIVDAQMYFTKAGYQWRLLPKDFPPLPTVQSLLLHLATRRRTHEDSRRPPAEGSRQSRPQTHALWGDS